MGVPYFQRPTPLEPKPIKRIPVALEEKLGRGLAAPLVLDRNVWAVRTGISKIQQSMYIILSTPIGRRFLQPDFGSLLPYLMFEPWNSLVRHEMIFATKDAIKTWLPVVTVIACDVSLDSVVSNSVNIDITYQVKGTLATNTARIVLSQDDNIKLSPNKFTINGKPVF